MSAIAAGFAPNTLSFYTENMASVDAMGDALAKIVMQRFRDARQYKQNNNVFQGKSTVTLLQEADYAMEKRYTPGQAQAMSGAFGFCPSRYYGLIKAKTTAIADWKSELVSGDPGALMQVMPTPDPRLDKATINEIKEGVKQDLIERMMLQGVGDPGMLLDVRNNRLHDNVKKFLDSKAKALRQIEQARIVAEAKSSADRIQLKVRDIIIEGGFREAYAGFNMNQFKYGVAIMRYPYWRRTVVLADNQDRKGRPSRMIKTLPTFANVSPWNFFPTADGRTVMENTGNTEYREVNKITLVGLAKDPRYKRQAIIDIMETHSLTSRTWLFPEASQTESESGSMATYWGPEELVPVLYHEGQVTGRDLHEMGETGYDDTEVYNIVAEVCLGRTIRLEVKNPTAADPRSYVVSKFDELGPGIWNAVGVPAILQDTQDRLNVTIHIAENNLDWSSRPPLQTNSEAFKNPHEASQVQPGGKYEISDLLGSGASVPDPIRPMRAVSSQYQIIWNIAERIIRQADGEIGVPDLADMQTFGRGSLGEYSARVSNAVRRIRNAAFTEDRSLKGIWQTVFEYVLDENPEMVAGADLDSQFIGIVGLLNQEMERKAKAERLNLSRQAVQEGMAPKEVAEYAYTDMLQDMGVPTEALGMSNPLTENAIAIATAAGPVASGPSPSGAIPQLDGRSGAIANVPTAVAAPNGAGAGPLPPPV